MVFKSSGGSDGAITDNRENAKEDAQKRKRAQKVNSRTARNIELYSLAYSIAWKQISPLRKREQPDISLQLHASIRQQLKKGVTDPLVIAVEAFKGLDDEEPELGTPEAQES
jgi:hypothetical protein